MEKTIRACRYLRVSRPDQNPNMQADATEQLIRNRGWDLVDTYLDHASGGSVDNRPELERLLADARRKNFDVLVVWRSCRMFRSVKDMITMLDDLAALSIGFVSVMEPFDTTTPSGRMFVQVVSAFNEFERQILIDRTIAGLEASRRRGVKLGRRPKKIDIDEAQRLRASGKSLLEIGKQLGCSAANVLRKLRDAEKGAISKTSEDLPENSTVIIEEKAVVSGV